MMDSFTSVQALSRNASLEIKRSGQPIDECSEIEARLARDIQILFEAGTAGGLGDRQLLDRFAAGDDAFAEAAFEVLLLRHGPMVLRVCRNLLRNSNDAEDAFQATFLVLLRRRGAIGRHESIAGWLYGVACRVAARARVDAARAEPLSIGLSSGSSRRSVPRMFARPADSNQTFSCKRRCGDCRRSIAM